MPLATQLSAHTEVTRSATPAEGLPLRPPFRFEVLKQDAMSRVERVFGADGTCVRKTYAPRRFFLWRTFLRPAKAKREHDNLRALAVARVPVTAPLHWQETRVLGCVPQSCLWLTDAGDVANLKDALTRERAAPARRALAVAFGALLRGLHAAGFVSLTAYPRNVLVADPSPARLLLCDQPYLVRRRQPICGAGARVDLFDALFTPGRARMLSRCEKLRALVAYAGDRRAAATLWRTLAGRRVAWQRFVKGCIKVGRALHLWSRQP